MEQDLVVRLDRLKAPTDRVRVPPGLLEHRLAAHADRLKLFPDPLLEAELIVHTDRAKVPPARSEQDLILPADQPSIPPGRPEQHLALHAGRLNHPDFIRSIQYPATWAETVLPVQPVRIEANRRETLLLRDEMAQAEANRRGILLPRAPREVAAWPQEAAVIP